MQAFYQLGRHYNGSHFNLHENLPYFETSQDYINYKKRSDRNTITDIEQLYHRFFVIKKQQYTNVRCSHCKFDVFSVTMFKKLFSPSVHASKHVKPANTTFVTDLFWCVTERYSVRERMHGTVSCTTSAHWLGGCARGLFVITVSKATIFELWLA